MKSNVTYLQYVTCNTNITTKVRQFQFAFILKGLTGIAMLLSWLAWRGSAVRHEFSVLWNVWLSRSGRAGSESKLVLV